MTTQQQRAEAERVLARAFVADEAAMRGLQAEAFLNALPDDRRDAVVRALAREADGAVVALREAERIRRAVYSVWPGLSQMDMRRVVAAILPEVERIQRAAVSTENVRQALINVGILTSNLDPRADDLAYSVSQSLKHLLTTTQQESAALEGGEVK